MSHEIVKEICVLEESRDGSTIQANIVSWYGRMPVLDIRRWTPEGKPTKGICLSKEGLQALKDIIEDITL